MLSRAGMGERAVARCDALGVPPFSDTAEGLFRAWLTPGFARTQQQVATWMAEAGMSVRLDPATNLIGRYEAAAPDAPALLIGSHLDSVRDAGRYDGPLGVMLGIECVGALHAEGRRLPFAIEVIGFGDEEGSRFPASMLTSRAVAGTLAAGVLDVADAEGTTVAEALTAYRHPSAGWGLSGADDALPHEETPAFAGVTTCGDGAIVFDTAARPPASVLAYLEAHIEQGPILDTENMPLGIVTGIAAQLRYRVTIDGTAGHAGTTPMALRHDALAAAAEMVLAVEAVGQDAGGEVVATVGRIEVAPGAPNVIPGRVAFALDIRAPGDPARDATAAAILTRIDAIAARRGLATTAERVQDLAASPCDPRLADLLARAVVDIGQPVRRLASGAGHDAMVMAALCPTAMLFVRCAGGVSHHPAEAVDPADADLAARAMLRFIDLLGDECAA